MTAAATAGAAAATTSSSAAAAAIAQATKASGVIVRVEPADFLVIVQLNDQPLVVHATGGFFKQHHQYLTSYRGLAFFTKSPIALELPDHGDLVEAQKIWIPG